MQIRLLIIGVVAVVAACGGDSTGPDGLTPVASLTIADLPDTLLTRQTLQLAASAADDDGSLLPDRPLQWASSNPDVVSITAGGTLMARTPGVATISVGTGATADSASVVVRSLNFAHVFAGSAVSCGLEASGEAWCWGNVGADGYGNGSLDSARTLVPSRAAKGHTFSSLALAPTSACGVELSGGVVCWGANEHGQLGDGTTTAHGAPVPVPGVSSIVQLVAGTEHYCARSDAGPVTCWGSNEWKQTGLDARALATPSHAVPLSGRATDLSAGDFHTCALVSGVSYCWGADYSRQLGNDTTYDRLVPVLAATGDGVSRTWTDVQAVSDNTCARDGAGAIFCWGIVEAHGDNDTTEWLPTRHFAGVTASILVDGWFERCALSDQGVVWCSGEVGEGAGSFTPSAPIQSLVVEDSDLCLLDNAGAVACHHWPNPPDSLIPVALPAPVTRLVASGWRTCALDTAGKVYCWTGDGSPEQWFSTHAVASVFASSGERTCIIAQDGSVWCRSAFDADDVAEPTVGLAFGSVAVGGGHTCGLTAAGAAWCWGSNTHGQLGDGTAIDRTVPVAVQGGHVFSKLAAGSEHSCGLTTSGQIWCWGNSSWGRMGDDHRDESAAPVTVDGLPSLTDIADNCALSAGSAWCWPTSRDIPSHLIDGATGLTSLSGPCGLHSSGELLCWGRNGYGRFGNGTYNNVYTDAVPGGSGVTFKEVSLGEYGTACGIGLDGATYCWGYGYSTVPAKMIGSP